jgi:recombination protein RecA
MRTGVEEHMSDKFTDFFKSFQDADSALDFKFANVAATTEKLEVIKTGSYLLDDMIGCGGLPKGRCIQFFGPPGSCKSLMSFLAIKEAQKVNDTSKQVFIDSEGTFSTEWCATLGLDLSRILIVDGDTAVDGKKCFTFLLGTPREDAKHNYAGKKQEGLFDKIASKELDINMVVLDSIGSIIPPQEMVSDIGGMRPALLSRFLTPVMRKVSLECAKANVPFIMINHKKSSLDMYANDHQFSGGNSYSHFLSANIYFESVNRKDAQIFDEKENKIGATIRATLEKSKFSPWPRKTEIKINFGSGIVGLNDEIAQLALNYNIVQQPTKMTYQYGNDYKWVGYQKFADALSENKALADEILQKVAEARENKSKPLDTPKTSDILDGETTSSEKKSKKKGVE